MKSIYPLWFRGLCAVIRKFFDKLEVRGTENIKQPCVFITRHLNNYGPLAVYLYIPVPFHLWTYYPFMDPKAYVDHVVAFTFTERVGMPLWLAKLCAQILKYPATWSYRAVGMIPVYRGVRETLKTMDLTVDCLEKGENVLIFPDVNYIDNTQEIGEIYTGFIRLGKMYHKRTGKCLVFQPVSVNPGEKYMRFGAPIEYDPTQPAHQEKERILHYLRKELRDNYKPESEEKEAVPHTS